MNPAPASRSPLAGLGAVDRPILYLLGLLSALKASALVGLATALSAGLAGVIDGRPDWGFVLALGLTSALARALVVWARGVVAARALLGTKERLRAELAESLTGSARPSAGSSSVLATTGLDGLDKYYTVFLPALVNAATIPLLIGVRILFADWVSALVVVLTVPLIPVFMALIGVHTRERVATATDSLARLSDHLLELARGLPVLVGLGRAKEQSAALRRISEKYRGTTMETLRTAFLSSLALELIATISVAVVAVFIGVRLVAGELPLEIGLLALLLAPECFTPFREIGTAFHASEDGREALQRVTAIVDSPKPRPLVPTTIQPGDTSAVRVTGLTVRYADRSRDAIHSLDFAARRGRIAVLDGRSGAGKSTVFAVLAGLLCDGADARVTGSIAGLDRTRIAWLPQHPQVLNGTVREELELYADAGADADTGRRIDELLAGFGLSHLAGTDTATISTGELRRLAFARVMLRVDAGATLVLLDEPTSGLDDDSAGLIVSAIAGLRGRVTVVVASHDAAVRALADHRVAIDGAAGMSVAAQTAAAVPVVPERDRPIATRPSQGRPDATKPVRTGRAVLRFLAPRGAQVIGAILLGTLATLFSVSLTGLSGWLIVRASQQPPIMYLLVAIVGVRFFGIGRAVLRYSERLLGHSAVFAAVTTLRGRLWDALAAGGLRSRSLLRGGSTLDHLVGDVDQMRDLSIRVALPAVTGSLSVIAAVTALGIVYPPVLPLFVALALAGTIGAPLTALIADRSASRSQQSLRGTVLRRFAAMLIAADDLRVNGVDDRVRLELRSLDARAGRAARHGAWALGLGSAVVVLACSLAAILVLPAAAAAVASGALRPELVAVLALTPLGLIDPLLELVAAVQNYPNLQRVVARLEPILDSPLPAQPSPEADTRDSATEARVLRLADVAATWPDAGEPVFAHVSTEVRRGEWLVVTGASGSGKSTLLAVLLGQLAPSAGRYLVNGHPVGGSLGARVGWCPQEGHLFDSTLRGNLLLARGRADAPDDSEMFAVLWRVGLGALLDRLPEGLDTMIGAGGHSLSGGERQRVAVARTLLTRCEIILIDEPTAHLDAESAEALMADLRLALSERITVLVTHQGLGLLPRDIRVDLDQPSGLTGVPPMAISPSAVGGAA